MIVKKLLRSIEPVTRPLGIALVDGWIWLRTRGLHPMAPDHARYAIRRSAARGGVRVR